MSPVFHRESSYSFKIFSNEELRMHIHVIRDDKEAKFWLEPEVELAENKPSAKSEETINTHAEKMQRALRHTIVTKRVVKLFFENMTENDRKQEEQQE